MMNAYQNSSLTSKNLQDSTPRCIKNFFIIYVFCCFPSLIQAANATNKYHGESCDTSVTVTFTLENTAGQGGGAGSWFSADIDGNEIVPQTNLNWSDDGVVKTANYRVIPGKIYKIGCHIDSLARFHFSVVSPTGYITLIRKVEPTLGTWEIQNQGAGSIFHLPLGTTDFYWEFEIRPDPQYTSSKVIPVGKSQPIKLSDVIWRVGMGALSNGNSAGFLQLCGESIDLDLVSRKSLVYGLPFIGGASDVVVVRDTPTGNDNQGYIRQIKAPQCLVDILDLTAEDGFEIHFYPNGNYNDQTGLYIPDGQFFVSYKVYLEQAGSLIIRKTDAAGTVSETISVSGTDNNQGWSLARAGGITSVMLDLDREVNIDNQVIENLDVSYSNYPIPISFTEIYHSQRIYEDFEDSRGEQLVSLIYNSGASERKTVFRYYSDDTKPHSHGRLKAREDYFGSWNYYLYNDISTPFEYFNTYFDSDIDQMFYYYSAYAEYHNLYQFLPYHGQMLAEFRPLSEGFNFDIENDGLSEIELACSSGEAEYREIQLGWQWNRSGVRPERIYTYSNGMFSDGSGEVIAKDIPVEYKFLFPIANDSCAFNFKLLSVDQSSDSNVALYLDGYSVPKREDAYGDNLNSFKKIVTAKEETHKTVHGYTRSDYQGILNAFCELTLTGKGNSYNTIDLDSTFQWFRSHYFNPSVRLNVEWQYTWGEVGYLPETNWKNFCLHGFTTHSHSGVSFDIDAVTLVPGESTKELKVYNDRGELKREEFWVYTTDSEWKEIEVLTYDYNNYSRLTQITSSNGSNSKVIYEATWNGLLKDWETDASGNKTTFGYDGLERVQTTTQSGLSGVTGIPASIASTTYYDALDRPVYTETGTGNNEIISSRKLDAEGLLLEETDRNGLKTEYAYSKNATAGRQIDITYPGNFTEIRIFHKNGRLKSVTGDAVVDQHYTYSYNFADGTNNLIVQTDTGYVSDSSTDHPVSRRSLDFLGRVTKEEVASSVNSQDFERIYSYDTDTGRLDYTTETEVAAGSVTGSAALKSYYDYTAMGQIKRSGVDLSGDDALSENSTDRLADGQSLYVTIAGEVWMQTTNTVYPEGGTATAFNSYTRSKLTGLDTNTLSVTEVEDVAGNITTTTVTVDRTNNTITTTVDYPDSDTDEVSVTQNGFLKSFTSKEGHETTYGYDEVGRQILETNARGISTVTKYEANKDRVEYIITGITDTVDGTEDISTLATKGYVTQYSYESDTGRLAWEKNPEGNYIYYSYNSRGQLEKQWGDATYPVWYEYDALGQLEKQHTYSMANVPAGVDFTQSTWPAGAGDGDVTTFTYYNESGLIKIRTDALNRTITYTYDQRNRLRTEVTHNGGADDPAITKTYSYYPKTDELQSVTYSGGSVTTPNVTYTYHRSGDLKSVTETGTTAREFHYDFDSTTLNHTDLQWLSEDLPDYYTALSSVASNDYGYDHDRLLNSYQSVGLKGRLGGFKLGVGNSGDDTALTADQYTSSYQYDTQGRFNQVTPETTATWTYGYTANSNLLSGRSLAGSNIATSRLYEADRDLLSSIDTLSAPGNSVAKYAYRYNALGNRTDVIQTGSQFDLYGTGLGVKYKYNDRQEVTGFDSFIAGSTIDLEGNPQPVPGRNHAFAYDDIGNRKSLTYVGTPEGDLSYNWQANALNRLTERTNPDFVMVQGTSALNSWVTVGFAPDDFSRAQRAGTFFSALFNLRDSTAPEAFSSNNLDVFSVIRDGWLDSDGATVLGDLIDQQQRELWLPPATETFTYDVRGNLKSDGRWDYTWDAENRLVFIETTATAITAGASEQKFGYRYDYSGRRYAKDVYTWTGSSYDTQPSQTTLYYYDGWNLVYEARYSGITYSGGNPASANFDGETAYYWGLDWSTTLDGAGGVGGLVAIVIRQAGETDATFRYPGYDGNGNLVTLLDEAGNVTASFEYGPYGELWRAIGLDAELNPFRFSTKYRDAETGLYYYGYRYYSPDYGRFLNQDPIGESGGLNLYAFVNNNPYNLYDYMGLSWYNPFSWFGGNNGGDSAPSYGGNSLSLIPGSTSEYAPSSDFLDGVYQLPDLNVSANTGFFGGVGNFFGDIGSSIGNWFGGSNEYESTLSNWDGTYYYGFDITERTPWDDFGFRPLGTSDNTWAYSLQNGIAYTDELFAFGVLGNGLGLYDPNDEAFSFSRKTGQYVGIATAVASVPSLLKNGWRAGASFFRSSSDELLDLGVDFTDNADEFVDVYRAFGDDARAQGFSWTTRDPRTVSNFRDVAGLPSGGLSGANNSADFLIQGRARVQNVIKFKSADPLDGNIGGLPELIIDPKNVNITDFFVLEP